MSKQKIRVIPARANNLIDTLYKTYQEQKMLFAREHRGTETAPQLFYLPKSIAFGSEEHVNYMFPVTTLTYRGDSDMWFMQAEGMYEKYPHLFSDYCVEADVLEIEGALKDVGFTFPGQGAGYWKRSMQTLFEEFDGRPLGLYQFADVDHYLAYKRKLSKRNGGEMLPGIGPKIYSLLGVFYKELGALGHYPDGTFPVDLHVMRIFISTGAVVGEGIVDAARTLAETLRKYIWARCNRLGYSIEDMAHAFWFLGSRMCYRCPEIRGVKWICPVYDSCSGTPATKLYSKKGYWNFDDLQRLRKGHPQPLIEDSAELALSLLPNGSLAEKVVFIEAPEEYQEQMGMFTRSPRQ